MEELSNNHDWKLDPKVEDLYWYCLTKNFDYIRDLDYLLKEIVPVFELSYCYPLSIKKPLKVAQPIDYGKRAEDYFVMENTDEEMIEDFKAACASYYGFLLKWRVLPFDYCRETRFVDGEEIIKVLKRDEIRIPLDIDILESKFEVPDHVTSSVYFDHHSIKGVTDQLNRLKDIIDDKKNGFVSKKKRNKNPSFEVAIRSILSFNEIFTYQFKTSELDFNSFLWERVLGASENMTAKKYFERSHNRDNIWPSSTIEIYKRFKYDVSDHNKFTNQRNKDFQLALELIQNPSWILSWYS